MLIRTPYPAHLIFDRLLARGVLVRVFDGAPRLVRCLRVTARTRYENARCVHALRESMAELRKQVRPAGEFGSGSGLPRAAE